MTDSHTNVTTPTTFSADSCSLKDVLERVGDKWSILVVAALAREPNRFRGSRCSSGCFFCAAMTLHPPRL
jgi:DNA-binding HxlR family transcriptional regulator